MIGHRFYAAAGAALVLLACLTAPAFAQSPLVVTTLPYLERLVAEIGGNDVRVEALAPPGEDPHYISPSPAQTALLREAAGFVENGVSLEPWTARLLEGARNPRLAPGAAGHVYAAEGVRTLDRPSAEEAAAGGHVHAGGNPHVWLDPVNLKRLSRNIEDLLAALDPGQADAYKARREAFEAEIDERMYGDRLVKILGAELLDDLHQSGRLRGFLAEREFRGAPLSEQAGGWVARAAALGEPKVFSYHATWRYFQEVFGVNVLGAVEEKPGIAPSAAHLEQLQKVALREGVRLIVTAPYYPANRAAGLAEQIGGKVVTLPTQPGEAGTKRDDLLGIYDAIFDELERGAGD
ncbi:MAG: metal ABC transporter substrate-binding protein [Pseudomonadota bacterium]